jgi:hypothetical protein
MSRSTRRLLRPRTIALFGLLLALAPAQAAFAQAPTWGEVQPVPAPRPGLFGSQPLFGARVQPKPLFIAGYGGTAYPPLIPPRTALRPTYGRTGLRGWFWKLKQGR